MIQSADKKICKSKALGGEGGAKVAISSGNYVTEIGITINDFGKKEKILAGIQLTFDNGQVRKVGSFFEETEGKEDKTKPLKLQTLSLVGDVISSIEVNREEHKVFIDADGNNFGITHLYIVTGTGRVLSSGKTPNPDKNWEIDRKIAREAGWISLTDEDDLPIKNVQLIGLFGRSGKAIDKLGVYVS